jgi:hypothetical protein
MSFNDKMTAIANKIRSILGVTGVMGLDDMSSSLSDCQDIVDSQAALLDQAIIAIANKSSGERVSVLQSKNIQPSKDVQVITADSGYDGLSSVTISPVNSASGLPNGITKIAAGTIVPTSDTSVYEIMHNLGVHPNFFNVIATGSIKDTDFINYIIHLSMYTMNIDEYDMGHASLSRNMYLYCPNDGGGVEIKCNTSSPDYHFNEETALIDLSYNLKLKSGVTYMWICGVADF